VKVDAGRNLTLTSEQDSDRYDSKQQSAGAGGSFTFGSATGSANVNVSRDKMHSTWQSVAEQTGIFAGKGGFDVTVGEHTQLNGAVIASTADASLNRLDTGTLGFGDIENHAEYKVEHQSAGISTGGGIGGQFESNMAQNVLAGLNGSGSADSTTHSAVSEGSIVIRDTSKQTQDVADLSRDVENANPGLDVIFDKEKEQNRLKAAQLIAEIGSQAGDIARTQGQIAGMQAQQDPAALAAAREELAGKGKLNPTADEIAKQAYDTAMGPFGTGSALQQGISAVTAAVQGLSGGNVAQAVSGAAAPYVAEKIHDLTQNNPEAQAMAHAVVGAVASYASGNSALAGAAGGVSGELMAKLVMNQLYPGKAVGDLSETGKQTVSALGTMAAGLAGGVVGDSTADAVSGAQAGQNAVNNNLFGGTEEGQETFVREHGKDVLSCADDASSASCQRGEAVNKAIAVALGAGAAGGAVIAATPELIATVQAAISGCGANPVLCANEVSIWVAEMAAGDALPAGLTVATVSKIPAEKLSELKALMTVEKQTGSKVTKESLEGVVSSKPSSGAENAATYPKLKDDLVQQNLNNIAAQDSRLAAAVKGSNTNNPNFSVGMATATEADRLGKIWVGDGARLLTDGKGWVSTDGTRVYRFPASKPNTPQDLNPTGVQANFETLKDGKRVSNGHMGITQ